ncbi:MAG: hypothetical protein REI11_06395, partial [Patulibacter sp.]|nr:hypothetical protein [Patulibacter sp.]
MRQRVPKVLGIGGAVLALGGTAFAANQIAGRDRAPAAAAVTIDSTAPLFTEAGLVNGQTFDRCTVLTNQGPQPADVSLFGTASQSDLSPWLHLELIRGTLPAGNAAGDCTGFTADTEDWGDGKPGVVYDGTLADLPGDDNGIADPTRWAVGEQHAYLLRVHYTGDDPQQGLSTTQSFSWGATPFDDRGPDPFDGSGGNPTPITDPVVKSAGTTPGGSILATHQCTIVTFPSRSYVGARAISGATKVTGAAKRSSSSSSSKAKATKAKSALLSSDANVVSAGETITSLTSFEIAHRKALLAHSAKAASASAAARRRPVLAVRLAPSKNGTLAIRVGIRKNGFMTSPHRWQWVRVRVNSGAAKSTLTWPFSATADMKQLKTGYNQIDLT